VRCDANAGKATCGNRNDGGHLSIAHNGEIEDGTIREGEFDSKGNGGSARRWLLRPNWQVRQQEEGAEG